MERTKMNATGTATDRSKLSRDHGPRYRLLHSSCDVVIADRLAALRRLARLPGAKLFVLPAAA